jgi:hypothetical protein
LRNARADAQRTAPGQCPSPPSAPPRPAVRSVRGAAIKDRPCGGQADRSHGAWPNA